MNTLSTKTLGHLIHLAVDSGMDKSDVRDLLMQSGIYDATGMGTAGLVDRGSSGPNKQELLRAPLLNAHEMASLGNREVHDALLEIVRLGAKQVATRYREVEAMLSALREALLSDGYELRISGSVAGWDTDWVSSREVQLLPVDPDAVPISTEITALEAELDQRGYTEAREHYRLAVKHFTEQDHPSANGQLRNMVESLVVHLAVDHVNYTDTGKANQGARAIQALYAKGGNPPAAVGMPLPEFDGGRMLHGIWETLHPSGSHPGLSDVDEARFRMQLCTGLARFLLKHFPVKP